MVFLVVKDLLYDIILRLDFLVKQQGFIDFRRNVVVLKSPVKFCLEMEENKEVKVVEEYDECAVDAKDIKDTLFTKLMENKLLMDPKQRQDMFSVLCEYHDVFEKNPNPILNFEFTIKLSDETPFRQRNYPIPVTYRDEVMKLIDGMERDGVVKKMNTPYCSPLVVVRNQIFCEIIMSLLNKLKINLVCLGKVFICYFVLVNVYMFFWI